MRSITVAYTDSGLSIQPRRWALYRVQTNSRRPLDRLQLKYVFFCTLWPCNLDLWLFDLISMVDKGTARWYVVNRFPVFLVLRPSILPALAYDFLMSVRPDQLACISPTPRNSRSSKIHLTEDGGGRSAPIQSWSRVRAPKGTKQNSLADTHWNSSHWQAPIDD